MSIVSGFLSTVVVIDGLLLVLIVMLQKGKGGVGLAGFGGGAQMLFGGSGGQDLFQKVTWVLGAILMGTSLLLVIVKSNEPVGGYGARIPSVPAQMPVAPRSASSEQSMPISGEQQAPAPANAPAQTPETPQAPAQ